MTTSARGHSNAATPNAANCTAVLGASASLAARAASAARPIGVNRSRRISSAASEYGLSSASVIPLVCLSGIGMTRELGLGATPEPVQAPPDVVFDEVTKG